MQERCKLAGRHGHVTWFGTNAYAHGTPRLFQSPSCTTPPRRCRQAKASAHKTPSLVHRHRLSRSPGRNPLRSFSTKEGVSSSLAQSVVATPHQVGGSHDRSQGLLATARLLSRELSQELIPITSTKHSHKVCLSLYDVQ